MHWMNEISIYITIKSADSKYIRTDIVNRLHLKKRTLPSAARA